MDTEQSLKPLREEDRASADQIKRVVETVVGQLDDSTSALDGAIDHFRNSARGNRDRIKEFDDWVTETVDPVRAEISKEWETLCKRARGEPIYEEVTMEEKMAIVKATSNNLRTLHPVGHW